jgi:uncharacterized protein with von Willebrand factor type A (vWA) domain
MYPFAEFQSNLAAFCATLRRTHDFRIGAGELLDAVRALETVNLADERQVRHALRPVLSSTREHAGAFDAAFTAFFFPGPSGVGQPGQTEVPRADRGAGATGAPAASRTGETGDGGIEEWTVSSTGMPRPVEDARVIDEEAAATVRASYSPLVAEGRTRLVLGRPADEWVDAARVFMRALRMALSRRWRSRRRGPRFDLRRTWRASLQTGGEPIAPRWLGRVRQRPRVVLLIDGSRSMMPSRRHVSRPGDAGWGTDSSPTLLAVALAGVSTRIEVLVFSTSLRPITSAIRRAVRQPVSIDLSGDVWGGGTAIGTCLRQYLRTYAGRGLARDTLVIIASDGLDVGDPATLAEAMRDLRGRAGGVVWLNPLMDTPGYQPTARGMLAALPFVSTLAAVSSAADLHRLSHRLKVRARAG